MEIKQLNELLKDLQNPSTKRLKLVKEENGHIGIPNDGRDGEQGEYNETFKIYQLLDSPELFMKITYNTNSYGYDEFPVSVAFLKAKEKTVTVYEYE